MPKSRLPDTNASTIGSGGRIVAVVDGEVVAGSAAYFSNVLLVIMYCVTGELPAAQGCRPTETLSGFSRCARTIAGAAIATDAAPAAAMKRRREALAADVVSMDMSFLLVLSVR